MKKKNKLYVSILLLQFVMNSLLAQPFSVVVTTTAIPPLNPAISQGILSGQVNTLLINTTVGAGNLQVLVFGRIDCLSPSPFSIALNPNYFQQTPIVLVKGIPVQLNPNQMYSAFGNFNPGNLVTTGVNISSLTDANNNIQLPSGTYRICFAARSFSPTGGIGPYVSDPNSGCGPFTICNKASAPHFTQPVNNFSINSSISTTNPSSPVVFSWTTPTSTCGAILNLLNYDFEIHELLPSQTVTDAINNPFLFKKTQLSSPLFLLDTFLNKNILQSGKQYVVRVRAYSAFNRSIQFDNYGYSRIEEFQYGNTTNSQNPPPPVSKGNPPNNNPPINAVGSDCGVSPPANTTLMDAGTNLSGASIKVGEFTLLAGTITRNSDGSYKGDGTIDWNPI